jgi:TolB-like protein
LISFGLSMAKNHLSRKLAVLLHADVVGSTSLVQKNETLAHERVQDTFRRFSETIGNYGGVALEIRGDALVAEFAKASDSVSASLAFQAANTTLNEHLSDDILPVLRIGIAMGEVVVADNTVTGEGIVLAQRLEQLAEPGSVCIQGAAYDTLPKRLPFEYENLGEQQVKGFDEPVKVYAVSLRPGGEIPESQTVTQAETSAPALPEKPSIAVLPFTNMSGDPEQEFFSDGITEDITTALSYFTGLFVIARNSSFSYKGESVDARQIASELGVRYLLEGSVRRQGNRIRLNSQLINAITGSHIWAERFDGDLDDIFGLQDDITRKIVGSIAPQIEIAEVDRSRGFQPTSLSSYELSLKAKSQAYDAFRSGDPDELQQAIDTANAALKQDSRNTHALWLLGIAQMDQYLYRWGKDPDKALNRAFQAVESLVRVDSSNADGFTIRGNIRTLRREYDLAVADFSRAVSINPNAATTLFFAAWGESLAGLTALAREHAELGLRLSPREMDLWLAAAYLALTQASFAEEDFAEAMRWGHLSIQLHSKAPIRRALMVACCAYTGDFEQAALHADELKSFAPDFIPTLLRGDMLLYKMPEHNKLLVDGLRKAGLKE